MLIRLSMLKRSVMALSAALVPAIALAQAQMIDIVKGGTHVGQCRQSECKCYDWTVYFVRNGKTWGQEDRKTFEEAREVVEWARRSHDPDYNSDPQGPFCEVLFGMSSGEPPDSVATFIAQVRTTHKRFKQISFAYQAALSAANDDPERVARFAQNRFMPRPFRDYSNLLKDAQIRIDGLRLGLTSRSGALQSNVTAALASINAELNEVQGAVYAFNSVPPFGQSVARPPAYTDGPRPGYSGRGQYGSPGSATPSHNAASNNRSDPHQGMVYNGCTGKWEPTPPPASLPSGPTISAC